LTRQQMARDPHLTYQAAFDAVLAADPQLASDRWDAVQGEIVARTKAMMASHPQLTYLAAHDAVLLDDGNLAREYARARMGVANSTRPSDCETLGADIHAAVTERLAASSRVPLDYGQALSLVLREQPDLARRYKKSMR
jgi:hypothetical protein